MIDGDHNGSNARVIPFFVKILSYKIKTARASDARAVLILPVLACSVYRP